MSDTVLVTYATKYGSTAELARRIADRLRVRGFDVDLKAVRDVRDVEPYRSVVAGSAVYMGRWRRDALRLLRSQCRQLSARPVWLFSSGPVGDQPTHSEDPKVERWLRPRRVEQLATEIGARDHAVFGGAVGEDGGFLRRRMAADTEPELRDRRDWQALEAWADTIAEVLERGGSDTTRSPVL